MPPEMPVARPRPPVLHAGGVPGGIQPGSFTEPSSRLSRAPGYPSEP